MYVGQSDLNSPRSNAVCPIRRQSSAFSGATWRFITTPAAISSVVTCKYDVISGVFIKGKIIFY